MMAHPESRYLGNGLYKLPLSDLIGLYIKVEDPSKRAALHSLIAPPPASIEQPDKKMQTRSSKKNEFLQNQQDSIEKAIRRQVEYYFSDANFP